MSETVLVDHKVSVNRAFESTGYQPKYYDQNCMLRRHGSMANGMQLHSVFAPQPVPAWNYMYSALHQYGRPR